MVLEWSSEYKDMAAVDLKSGAKEPNGLNLRDLECVGKELNRHKFILHFEQEAKNKKKTNIKTRKKLRNQILFQWRNKFRNSQKRNFGYSPLLSRTS